MNFLCYTCLHINQNSHPVASCAKCGAAMRPPQQAKTTWTWLLASLILGVLMVFGASLLVMALAGSGR